jgi:DNA-binding transcriptional MerR regulator
MAGYRISEVAERTGFSASTLRFYEDAGLIAPASRSSNGYRVYDDRDLDRLRFIARSKRLGLTLDEITALVELFDLDECAPVQQRLRELLVAKRRDLAEQIAELETLSGELAHVANRLDVPASPGACDDACACLADGDSSLVNLPTITTRQLAIDDVPIACTLDTASIPERLAAWRSLAERVVERVDSEDGVRVRFGPEVSAVEVADLAAKEQHCCSFLRFSLDIRDRETILHIAAPPEAREMVDALVPAL